MKKILIVEDEVVTVFLLRKLVNELGYTTVNLVSSGIEAIEAVKNLHPDLILMDINLNRSLDGISTMALIRQFSMVPVIYLTAFASTSIKLRSRETPNSQILEKPVDIQTLKKTIEDLLVAVNKPK